MQGKTKSKLCWNCEGSAPYEAENCPYCGVYLSPLALGDDQDTQNLFSPPYRVEDAARSVEETNETPYTSFQESNDVSSNPIDETVAIQSSSHPALSLVAVLAGFVFFLFGLALGLFAEDGTLTLRWSSAYWYLYLIVAIPLLVWGWLDIEKHRDG